MDVFEGPRALLGADWLAHGLTLWNPHLTSGNALASQAVSPLTPDLLLAMLAGPFAAQAITVWLTATAAGISMHLFLRNSLRLGTVAVIGGSTIALFGFWHAAYGFSAPLLPLTLWLLDRVFAGGAHRWRFLLAAVLVNAFALYEGISQVVLISAAIQLVYVAVVTSGHPALIRRLMMVAGSGSWQWRCTGRSW